MDEKEKVFCDNCHKIFEEGDEVISFDDSTYCDCDCMVEAVGASYGLVTYPSDRPVIDLAVRQPHKARVVGS
jgi:hypothetical protein